MLARIPLAAVPFVLVLLRAQEPSPLLDATRITSAEFASARFGPVRWLDGSRYATLIQNGDTLELVAIDARTDAREVLIGRDRLQRAGAPPIRIEDYAFSPDGRHALLFCDSERVWRQNTRGEYWLLNLRNADPARRLGGELPKSSLMFAKFAPGSDRVAYVSQNDLYVETLAGAQTRLTADGSRTTINGTFDWVYEEEYDCRDGFRWSPDGTRIAYWQLDATGVGEFLMIDNLGDRYSRVIPVQYPKAGTTNSSARIGVIDIAAGKDGAGGKTVWMQTPGEPRECYLPRLHWHPSGRELAIQWQPRAQNEVRLLAADAATGAVRVVHTDRDAAYVDVRDDFRWLMDGLAFFWTSDRSGWRHAYAFPWEEATEYALTQGDFDVIAVEHLGNESTTLQFAGSDGNATQRYLFGLDSKGRAHRLTPKDQPGWHEYQISADGSLAIHNWSAFDQPPVIDLVELPAHARVRMLVDNKALKDRYAAVRKGRNEFIQVKTKDGVTLDGWIMYPPDFDPARRWPAVCHVYGEPWAQTVLDKWPLGHHLFHRWLTQQGYVVLSLDARGTPAPKGRDWRKALHHKIGVTSSHDWDQAMAALCAQHEWPDASRLAIWGWSGGGAMTLNLLFRHPERFAAGISVAPVTDIALYDTIYQERYTGDPRSFPDVYRECSPITHAANLKSPLLLIHGTGDDNVHYQNSERLVDALVAHGKLFEFLAYPNRSHSIHEGKGTRAHLYGSMADFLRRRVPPGPR